MKKADGAEGVRAESQTVNLGRRTVLRGMLALGGALALGKFATAAQTGASGGSGITRLRGGRISVRWLGGGVAELATPDYKQIAYCDAWIWNNTGWSRFSVEKPPEYATKAGFVQYVAGKKPEAVFVLLTHDHGDHMGDYFEMLKGLVDAGLPVMTTGQSDLMRNGLVPEFKKAGLDPAKVVVNGGAGMNFGGISKYGAMTAHLVPAVHSNLSGYPAAGIHAGYRRHACLPEWRYRPLWGHEDAWRALPPQSRDRMRGRWPLHDGAGGRRSRVPVAGRHARDSRALRAQPPGTRHRGR